MPVTNNTKKKKNKKTKNEKQKTKNKKQKNKTKNMLYAFQYFTFSQPRGQVTLLTPSTPSEGLSHFDFIVNL